MDEHEAMLRKVFAWLRERERGLTISLSKIRLFKRRIPIVRFIVDLGEVEMLPDRLETIRYIRRPKNQRALRQLLGLLGFYCHFCDNYAEIMLPVMFASKSNKIIFVCTQEHSDCLERISRNLRNRLF